MGKVVENCPICGCENFTHKFYGKDYFYHTNPDKRYEIIECKRCKLEQQSPIPTFEEQQSFYPSNYYSYTNKSELNDVTKTSIITKIGDKLHNFVDDKKLQLPLKNGEGKNFLDIGCGEGVNLEIMNRRGWNSEGFEINNKLCCKNNIFYGKSITDIDFGKKYDLIRCHHVFEHVYNPNEFLDKVYSILNDNALFIICLPDVKGFSSKCFGKYAPDRDIPRHLFGYNYKNIQQLFKKHNFKIIHKNHLPNYGSFLGYQRYIYDKFGIKSESKLLGRLFFIYDIVLSVFKSTNQIGFCLKK